MEEYEAQLERLKRCGQAQPDAGALTPQRTWLHAVIQEQRKRRQAEQINAKLRQLLAERRQTAWAVRDALAKEKRLLSVSFIVGPLNFIRELIVWPNVSFY